MIRIIKLLAWVLIASGAIFFWEYSNFESTPLETQQGIFEVAKGDSYQKLLINLGASPLLTKVYLRNNTPEFKLQIGSYKIQDALEVKDFFKVFETAISNDMELTFLEGWNIFDIDEYLVQKGFIEVGDFIEYSENFCNASLFPGSIKDGNCILTEQYNFIENLSSLEGYLYPDTYAINPNTFTVKILVQKMLNNFESKVYQKYFSHLDNKTIFETITLASIVEKEEKNSQEKSTVAGILKKRLDEGWMIGADITVCYAHRLTAEQCKLSVTKYLYDKNDYNTRQKVGLPAGPIGNPSSETIQATFEPQSSPYYYYLHDVSTGQIYYGKTDAEHNRNKQLYIR